ncbi:hypothetical protein KAR91_18530, partial [Candidatus Pacearchaeota archaeon]|nr:hypothetical protein [Candidatus Pacearchaeota archaeon]
MTQYRDFHEAEIMANEYNTPTEFLEKDLLEKSKIKFRKPKNRKERMEAWKKHHNDVQDVTKIVSELSNSLFEFHPLYVEVDIKEEQKHGILLGHHYETNEEIRMLTEHLAADIISVGTTRTGKSLFNHLFIYNMYLYTSKICLIYLDFKGEVTQSLSYKLDGETKTILAERITEIKKYEKGMLNSMFGEDRIVVINLAYVKNDEILFRNTILNVLEDIHEKLAEFQKEFIKETDKSGKAQVADLPYKIGICYEEAYKIFPNMKSPVYAALKGIDINNENKRKMLKERLKEIKETGDIDSFKRIKKEYEEIPE